VLKSYHVHVGGRGGAFMQVEMKDIEAGTKTNSASAPRTRSSRAFVDPREMQFLYQDGDSYVFMDKGELRAALACRRTPRGSGGVSPA